GLTTAAPAGIHRLRPRWIISHAEEIFDDIRSAQVAPEPEANRGLAIAFDVPGDAYARLKPTVVRVPYRSVETASISLNQPAKRVLAVEQAWDVVAEAIVRRVGLSVSGPPQTQSERKVRTQLPGIVAVDLEVVPAAQRLLVVIELRGIDK